jgi:FtsP/CotA-like multicopper oxidase with cupredoxin domain
MFKMRICSLALLALATLVVAEDVLITWNLTFQDAVQVDSLLPVKKLILINNSWPPPVTTVNVNDMIYLTVINSLAPENTTTLHAHGFLQQMNNLYDGPEGITQW